MPNEKLTVYAAAAPGQKLTFIGFVTPEALEDMTADQIATQTAANLANIVQIRDEKGEEVLAMANGIPTGEKKWPWPMPTRMSPEWVEERLQAMRNEVEQGENLIDWETLHGAQVALLEMVLTAIAEGQIYYPRQCAALALKASEIVKRRE